MVKIDIDGWFPLRSRKRREDTPYAKKKKEGDPSSSNTVLRKFLVIAVELGPLKNDGSNGRERCVLHSNAWNGTWVWSRWWPCWNASRGHLQCLVWRICLA